MADAADYEYMARALKLARRGLSRTDPNPTVGCVLVRDGRIVAEGFTAPVGGPHAERVALTAAGSDAAGATAYVTLEPCSHTGRTGPCAKALIDARVARVVCGSIDPNPLVAGAGAEELRRAGIEVETGVFEASAGALNRGYFSRMTRKRPWLRLKIAASLDGRTALANGSSRWITGAAARADVHRWRARSSVVMTGIGTVLADDPALDARVEDDFVQPLRVILDSSLQTPPAAKTLRLPGRVIIFSGHAGGARYDALAGAGAELERVDANPHCDLHQVLARLAELECNDVWVEAGARLSGALLEAQLIDELILYMAPHLLGADARGMFETGTISSLAERHALVVHDIRKVGVDLRLTARPGTVADLSSG